MHGWMKNDYTNVCNLERHGVGWKAESMNLSMIEWMNGWGEYDAMWMKDEEHTNREAAAA